MLYLGLQSGEADNEICWCHCDILRHPLRKEGQERAAANVHICRNRWRRQLSKLISSLNRMISSSLCLSQVLLNLMIYLLHLPLNLLSQLGEMSSCLTTFNDHVIIPCLELPYDEVPLCLERINNSSP